MIHNQSQSLFSSLKENRFYLRRVADIGLSLAGGALAGYLFSVIKRQFTQQTMQPKFLVFAAVNQATPSAIPLPAMVAGLLSVAVIETLGLTYDIGLRILGERKFYENLPYPEEATPFDRFRQRGWGLVTHIEGFQQKIDAFVSYLLGIRSSQKMREEKIPLDQFHFLEIVRHAFYEQGQKSINEPYPSRGYTVLLINFMLSISDRMNHLFKVIHQEKIALREIQELEAKCYCDILETLYPVEFSKSTLSHED